MSADNEGITHSDTASEAVLVQLTVMFRPDCWWMAAFILVRRLVLIALLTWVRSSRVWNWLSMVNVWHSPLDTEFKKALETLTQTHDTQKKAVGISFVGEGRTREQTSRSCN